MPGRCARASGAAGTVWPVWSRSCPRRGIPAAVDRQPARRGQPSRQDRAYPHCRLAPAQVRMRPCTEVPRGVRGSPLTRWAEASMGRDIQAIKFSGEDRGRYRDKLRRSLEVFATMLREHLFDAEPAQVGLEIELNLVDGRGEPSMTN